MTRAKKTDSDPNSASTAAKVSLHPVQVDNWRDCIALDIDPDQEGWIPSNLYSIAEAQFYPESRSRAVYTLAGQLVGYTLFGRDIHSGSWKIFRLMIDRSCQGQGFGKGSLSQVLAEIAREPDGDRVLICYQESNQAARRLYAQFGFEELDTDTEGKVTAEWRRSKGG